MPCKPCLALAALALIAAAPAPHYAVAGKIALSDGGWDYASFDPGMGRVYVARPEGISAVDVPAGRALPPIGAIARGHSVVPIPGGAIVAVTSGRDDSVRLIDAARGEEIARIAVGADPDAAFYDPATRRVAVMNAKSGTISLIDPAARVVTGTIALREGLEFAVTDGSGTLYVNNEDRNEIETADLATAKPGAAIAMPGCEGPTGLGYDPVGKLLISACANGKAVIVDVRRRKVMALIAIGMGPDAVIIDQARRLAFVPCGRDGVLDVIALDASGGPRLTQSLPTEPGARTGTLDPRDGTLYLPSASFGPIPAGSKRGPLLPGTTHLLVIKRG